MIEKLRIFVEILCRKMDSVYMATADIVCLFEHLNLEGAPPREIHHYVEHCLLLARLD